MLVVLLTVVTLWALTVEGFGELPTGKCIHPIPSFPGMDLAAMEGEVFKYVYTPDISVFKFMDSIAMLIKRSGNNVYTEMFHAHTIFGTTTKVTFDVEYLGDGVLKMKKKKSGITYMASIVDVADGGNVGLLYVCSDDSKSTKEDMRYVIVRKEVDPRRVEHPDVLFKKTNEHYNFKGMFRKLPFNRIIKTSDFLKQKSSIFS